jgi:glutaredoxin
MRSTISILACVAALAVAADCAAQSSVYRWVDKDGTVHFSDAPPPESAKDVTRKRMGGGDADDGQVPYATQVAMKRNPVTLYASSACGDLCTNGRELLTRRGIPFSERDPMTNSEHREALRKLVGALEVPVLVVGATTLKGFDEDAWQGALDGAGYPRTRLPQRARAAPPPAAAQAAPEPGK